jgi:hypothetical protein
MTLSLVKSQLVTLAALRVKRALYRQAMWPHDHLTTVPVTYLQARRLANGVFVEAHICLLA